MPATKIATQPRQPQTPACCGVIEEATTAALEKRHRRTKPQPWIARKLMVGITLGIIGYGAYVYIQHLCLPMIKRRAGAPAGRGTGIALLTVFSVLYLWMVWAYVKAILTPPGYAKDHVPQSERPLIPASVPLHDSWHSTTISHSAMPADVEMNPRTSQHTRNTSFSTSLNHATAHLSQPRHEPGLAGPSYEDLLRKDGVTVRNDNEEHDTDPNASVLGVIPRPAVRIDERPAVEPPRSPTSSETMASPQQQHHKQSSSISSNIKLMKPRPDDRRLSTTRQEKKQRKHDALQRRPPTTAVLLPAHRYCTTEQFVKPYRSHHCRVCGTCVLKYDHHCPWIGQCVGARNHKFFVNFCQATTVFTSYVFATQLAYVIIEMNSTHNSANLNPQEIVLVALAALFFLFTSSLVTSHTHMILKGQTTVESMQIRSMKERGDHMLANALACWEFGAKRRKQREWDYEWGALNTEGNIWWRGSSREEWVDVMGKNRLGWIFPIGRSLSDGLSYPVNPRFDSEGRWRRRSEWPEHLR
ncbi:unnamed protein product [Cyclocybe aegerita]|uniref:Palmitoyltransferase n=1 Tax=Cyclocybe aegerita TaxID=1973307 RepID=A0A8S0WYS6_CYCAE|nr:unnamed protein product [Cyclocybe aegerita]